MKYPKNLRTIIDVTKPPYCADNTGKTDCTEILRKVYNDIIEADVALFKETFEKVQKEWEDYVNSCISRIMNTRIDESIEKPSFGKLSQIDCAIAIVNFFIDFLFVE